MIYVDTSFMFALFVEQDHSAQATKWMDHDSRLLWISSFSVFEFEQALRLQTFFFKQDRNKGLPERNARIASNHLQAQMREGIFIVCDYDWNKVLETVARLSAEHTGVMGCRSMDMIHVAMALHLGAREFLTFDVNQKKLALIEGLEVPVFEANAKQKK